MASKVAKIGAAARDVVPVISRSKEQARASVLAVYKQLQRRTPVIWWDYGFQDMPLPIFRLALKKEFLKNAHLNDLRVIDRKVEECKQHMYSLEYYFYNEEHIRNYLFYENIQPKPKDFLSKFLMGKE